MEFGTREILILLGIIIILGILLDGFRRVRQARNGSLRTARHKGSTNIFDDDPTDPGGDLATGQVRVTRRDPDSVEEVSDAMRHSREQLAGQCTSAFREINQARGGDDPSTETEALEDVPELNQRVPEPEPGRPDEAAQQPERPAEAGRVDPVSDEPEPQAPGPDFDLDPDERIEPTFSAPGEQPEPREQTEPRPKTESAGTAPPSGESAPRQRTSESSGRQQGPEVPDPEEVLVLHVMAKKGAHFQGPDLLETLLDNGLRFGSMEIFHRHEEPDGSGPVLFSLANSLKPGTFDLDAMDDFTTPGVTLFMPLQGLERPLDTFSLMLETARALAKNLDGELKDETRSALTRQTIEHYRQQIIEYTRRSFTLTN